MTDKQIKKLREVKRDRITWTGSIQLSCIVVCFLCLVVGVKAISGQTVDFLKDVEELKMPNFVGMTKEECENLPEQENMQINYVYTYSNTGKAGEVFQQSVEPGKSITSNQTITLKIQNGQQSIQVPNTVGLSVDEATTIINNLGLNYKLVYVMPNEDNTSDNQSVVNDSQSSDSEISDTNQQEKSDNTQGGQTKDIQVSQKIVSSDPKEFTDAKDGDVITLYVARPYLQNIRVVPDVMGKWWSEAENMMEQANIQNYKIFYIASDGEYNRVVSVWPKGQITTSDTVYIKVQGGPLYGLQ